MVRADQGQQRNFSFFVSAGKRRDFPPAQRLIQAYVLANSIQLLLLTIGVGHGSVRFQRIDMLGTLQPIRPSQENLRISWSQLMSPPKILIGGLIHGRAGGNSGQAPPGSRKIRIQFGGLLEFGFRMSEVAAPEQDFSGKLMRRSRLGRICKSFLRQLPRRRDAFVRECIGLRSPQSAANRSCNSQITTLLATKNDVDTDL